MIEMTAGSASNITAIFQNLQLPFDPYHFLSKYVPFVDWDEFKEQSKRYQDEKNAEDEIKLKLQAQMGMGPQ